MGALDWLRGGNDRRLASSSYGGRESASGEATRKAQIKRRIGRQIDVRDAARAGQAWEDNDRRREREGR
ncbi:hypothetical protein AB0A05_07525 [Streptomyces sp. NPDC046374]|uniref:hypothetical protein n=1 Tax=Streptomyces sp. NPDC046374 TaxID=3154917 RepID=UPI0033CD3D43